MTTTIAGKSRSARCLPDLLLGLLPILLAVQLLGWLTFFPNALRGYADFRQLFAAGYMVRTGHASELYDSRAQQQFQDALVGDDERALPFIRPAYQALLFVPFSLLPYRAAYLTFAVLNVSLLGVVFMLMRPRMEHLARIWGGFPVFVFLVFYPTTLALMQGQDSILLLALLAGALVALDDHLALTAGMLVGLGLFKMQIVIPIALLFLLWRRWRFVAGFGLSACLVSLASLWVTGWGQTANYVRSVVAVGASSPGASAFPLRLSIMANLRGLIFGLMDGRLPGFWIQGVTLVISILVLLWVGVSASNNTEDNDGMMIAITTSVMVSYYLFIHDLSVLLIPIVFVLDRYIHAATSGPTLYRANAWTAAALLVAPMCIFLMPAYFYLVSLPICAFMVLLMTTLTLGSRLGEATTVALRDTGE